MQVNSEKKSLIESNAKVYQQKTVIVVTKMGLVAN